MDNPDLNLLSSGTVTKSITRAEMLLVLKHNTTKQNNGTKTRQNPKRALVMTVAKLSFHAFSGHCRLHITMLLSHPLVIILKTVNTLSLK